MTLTLRQKCDIINALLEQAERLPAGMLLQPALKGDE